MKQIVFILLSLLIVVSCKPTAKEVLKSNLEQELTRGFVDVLGYILSFLTIKYNFI